MVFLRSQTKTIDRPLLGAILALVVFGLLAVFNASVAIALQNFGDKFYFFRSQLIWAGIGLILLLVTAQIEYQVFLKFSPLIFGVALISLVAVLLPNFGIKALGARRWLELGPIAFQPTELAKLALVLYLASFLAKKQDFWPFLAILAVLTGLTILEPDLGTAVIMAGTGIFMFFASGASILELLLLSILGIAGSAWAVLGSSYRRGRMLTLFNPMLDPLGVSYHIRQVLIAIGSGGWWGLGLGQSRQKFEYLPEATTDSIFAIIAEELGFFGGFSLVLLFLFTIFRIFQVAKACPHKRGSLLAIGVGSWLGIQTLVNLGAMVALLPLTGVPLPFISYGGSSLIINLVAIGIVLNVSKHKAIRK